MAPATLVPDPQQVELVTLRATGTGITAVARARADRTPCPVCGASAERVHSRYTRQVADLPWCGVAVRLQLQVRRFFCDQSTCRRAIFTERLPGVVAPYGRRTVRLSQLVELIGFLLGGSAGSRLLHHLAPGQPMGSRDTVLRTIRRASFALPQALHALSVDDFAFRRGVTYGTMLVDLERRRVVDLLAERSDVAFARWVRQHPEVRVVSRDRGGDYAVGATLGAPQAEQIADRFHLLVNASEVLDRCLTRHHARLREAALCSAPADAVPRATKGSRADGRRKQERHAAREQHFQHVVTLAQQGVSAHQIARRLGIARQTVAKFLQVAAFPEIALHARPRRIDPYLPYLRERWHAGEHNVRQLWREVRAQGYPCSAIAVRRIVSTWREPAPQPGSGAGGARPRSRSICQYATTRLRHYATAARIRPRSECS